MGEMPSQGALWDPDTELACCLTKKLLEVDADSVQPEVLSVLKPTL